MLPPVIECLLSASQVLPWLLSGQMWLVPLPSMRKQEGTLGHFLVLLTQGTLIPNQGQAMRVRPPGARFETPPPPLGCNSRVTLGSNSLHHHLHEGLRQFQILGV